MNKVILMGRLVRDPEVRCTQSGKTVCQFTLAVDRFTTNQDGKREADFVPIVVWGKVGELCGNSLTKGQRALIDGRLQIRSYEAKDGGKRWVTEVIATSVQFLDRKNSESNLQKTQNAKEGMESFGYQIDESEIPF